MQTEPNLISKSLKFSPAELAKILQAMEKAGYKEFSPYVRKVLLDEAEKENPTIKKVR